MTVMRAASESSRMTFSSARHGKTAAFGFLWLLAVPIAACTAPTGSKPAAPKASTPILTDFNRYCLGAHVDRELALADAKRAGLEIITLPADPSRPDLAMVGWTQEIHGKRVAVTYLGQEKGPDGVSHARLCEAMGDSDRGATLKAIDDWLGPGHPLRFGSGHEFQLKDGYAWPLAENDKKAVAAARAAGNYYFLLTLDHKGTTTLMLRRWRGPRVETPPAPLPSPRQSAAPNRPRQASN